MSASAPTSAPSPSASPPPHRSQPTMTTRATTQTPSRGSCACCSGARTSWRNSRAGTAARPASQCTCSGTASTSPPAASPASERQSDRSRQTPRRTRTRSSASASGPATGTTPTRPTTPTQHPSLPGSLSARFVPRPSSGARRRNGSLAILRYDDVRAADDPRSTLVDFLQSAFEAGASLAGWDLFDTATQWCPVPSERLTSRAHNGNDVAERGRTLTPQARHPTCCARQTPLSQNTHPIAHRPQRRDVSQTCREVSRPLPVSRRRRRRLRRTRRGGRSSLDGGHRWSSFGDRRDERRSAHRVAGLPRPAPP